ncbi:glycosyltransferase [Desulforhopalus singaporensis]|uniref:Glycosyltransferase involved in cell wall bisynthesis n=1 Tax=Desulforhopalus singaporensis TaxID=91360 RepID=A0A1H0P458_9BACT|nr:glycosyltransferase [Desulforhopalus singaporensis]SDO99744.1 Glycosyltransferase involved in cell wall bisynthesis [Desulforhopalus singaporensis]
MIRKQKPKLLVVTSTFPRWKEDTDPPFVYELSRRLTKKFDVIVHTPHYPGALRKENLENISVYRFRYFWTRYEKLAGSTGILPTLKSNRLYYGLVPFFLFAQFFSLLKLVIKNKPDVIHAHWIIPQGFVAVLVKLITGVPVVATAHGADIFGLSGAGFNLVKRFTLKKINTGTVVSQALVDAVSESICIDKKLDIIPMGVDSQVFTSERKDLSLLKRYNINGPVLLFVGRLTEKKGVKHLIDAMPDVLKYEPDARLLIVGSGELENKLRRQTESIGLKDKIHFVGAVSNGEIAKYYATADIFIGPSIKDKNGDTEGFGLTFVEAAMSGCLVIASDIGGVGDIVIDNETGFLVVAGNSKKLSEKIIFVLKNNNNFQEIAKKAREFCVENYEWKVIVTKYDKIFLKNIKCFMHCNKKRGFFN